jgi:hypothetical protein
MMKVASAFKSQTISDVTATTTVEARAAAPTTVEALMYSLRTRGTAALLEPDCRRRLSELNAEQTRAVAVRLQKLKPRIAKAWGAGEIEQLYETKAQL